jgi:hypothetical protein
MNAHLKSMTVGQMLGNEVRLVEFDTGQVTFLWSRSHSRPAAAVSGGLDGGPRRNLLATGLVGRRCGRAAG